MFKLFKKIMVLSLIFCLVFEQTGFAQVAAPMGIPAYLSGFSIQDKFRPVHLRYLSYDPLANNFDLLLDKGDAKNLQQQQIEQTTKQLLEYFQIGISLPNKSFWVNLRPDGENDVIDPFVEKTDLGKVLLEADLQLKKDMAKCTSPDTAEGRQYWDKLYQKAESLFGGLEVSIPTLTRPWIVPGEIIIRETDDSAYIYKATLKVMLEQDYLKNSVEYSFDDERMKILNDYSSQLIRQLVIPKLTKMVNSSKQYASLRQVYYSLILAQWFKQKFQGKQGVYSSRIDTVDLADLTSKTKWSKSTYFKAYQKSFKNGEYNLSESVYNNYGQTIRNYVSGGIALGTFQNIASAGYTTFEGAKDFLVNNRLSNALQRLSVKSNGEVTIALPQKESEDVQKDGGEVKLTVGKSHSFTMKEKIPAMLTMLYGDEKLQLRLELKDGKLFYNRLGEEVHEVAVGDKSEYRWKDWHVVGLDLLPDGNVSIKNMWAGGTEITKLTVNYMTILSQKEEKLLNIEKNKTLQVWFNQKVKAEFQLDSDGTLYFAATEGEKAWAPNTVKPEERQKGKQYNGYFAWFTYTVRDDKLVIINESDKLLEISPAEQAQKDGGEGIRIKDMEKVGLSMVNFIIPDKTDSVELEIDTIMRFIIFDLVLAKRSFSQEYFETVLKDAMTYAQNGWLKEQDAYIQVVYSETWPAQPAALKRNFNEARGKASIGEFLISIGESRRAELEKVLGQYLKDWLEKELEAIRTEAVQTYNDDGIDNYLYSDLKGLPSVKNAPNLNNIISDIAAFLNRQDLKERLKTNVNIEKEIEKLAERILGIFAFGLNNLRGPFTDSDDARDWLLSEPGAYKDGTARQWWSEQMYKFQQQPAIQFVAEKLRRNPKFRDWASRFLSQRFENGYINIKGNAYQELTADKTAMDIVKNIIVENLLGGVENLEPVDSKDLQKDGGLNIPMATKLLRGAHSLNLIEYLIEKLPSGVNILDIGTGWTGLEGPVTTEVLKARFKDAHVMGVDTQFPDLIINIPSTVGDITVLFKEVGRQGRYELYYLQKGSKFYTQEEIADELKERYNKILENVQKEKEEFPEKTEFTFEANGASGKAIFNPLQKITQEQKSRGLEIDFIEADLFNLGTNEFLLKNKAHIVRISCLLIPHYVGSRSAFEKALLNLLPIVEDNGYVLIGASDLENMHDGEYFVYQKKGDVFKIQYYAFSARLGNLKYQSPFQFSFWDENIPSPIIDFNLGGVLEEKWTHWVAVKDIHGELINHIQTLGKNEPIDMSYNEYIKKISDYKDSFTAFLEKYFEDHGIIHSLSEEGEFSTFIINVESKPEAQDEIGKNIIGAINNAMNKIGMPQELYIRDNNLIGASENFQPVQAIEAAGTGQQPAMHDGGVKELFGPAVFKDGHIEVYLKGTETLEEGKRIAKIYRYNYGISGRRLIVITGVKTEKIEVVKALANIGLNFEEKDQPRPDQLDKSQKRIEEILDNQAFEILKEKVVVLNGMIVQEINQKMYLEPIEEVANLAKDGWLTYMLTEYKIPTSKNQYISVAGLIEQLEQRKQLTLNHSAFSPDKGENSLQKDGGSSAKTAQQLLTSMLETAEMSQRLRNLNSATLTYQSNQISDQDLIDRLNEDEELLKLVKEHQPNQWKKIMESVQRDGGKGGIDFRQLPIVTQPSVSTLQPTAAVPAIKMSEADLDKEWRQIQNTMQSGPMPYQKIKEYVACCKNQRAEKQMDTVFACIANILRLEEEQALPTAPEIKEILASIG